MKVNIEENLVQSDRSIEVAAKRWRVSINQSIVNHSPALLFLPAIDTLLTQNKLKYNHKCRLKILQNVNHESPSRECYRYDLFVSIERKAILSFPIEKFIVEGLV